MTGRTERGSVQTAVYKVLEEAHPKGLTASQLKEKLPDVSQQSISNVLQKFTKDGTVEWEGRGKPYVFKPRATHAARADAAPE